MPPRSKRRRITIATQNSRANAAPPVVIDRATWPGWCEVESEPAFFNVMLQEMGVKGLKIHEVLALDDDFLAIIPTPVHAMIFLFRYREIDQDKQEVECPRHVWFANQVPDFACATVALLNIVNNIPEAELGPQLQSFKNFTQDFDPLSRGDAVDSFEFVKRIHNSFAKESDMLNIDLGLKQKNAKAASLRKNKAARDARAAVTAAKKAAAEIKPLATAETKSQATAGIKTQTTATRKSARTPKPRLLQSNDSEEEDGEDWTDTSGFHFIAYMPIADEIWKLDGLDSFPQNLGKTAPGSDWLSVVKPALQARMAQYEQGQIEFSLMAVVQDPIIQARQELARNIRSLQAVETRLDQVNPDWKLFTHQANEEGPGSEVLTAMSIDYGVSEADIQSASMSGSLLSTPVDGDLEKMISERTELVVMQVGCRAAVRDEMLASSADATKARLRRHDYTPFLTEWMGTLEEQGVLETLVNAVKASS